ncbi:hypothetical protein Nepgr_021065 [Nepenthes gracilis]|uniref:Uncharacterized protein n=1 Tax=Nepenthes gracilis TaxID=150966 RepID=A0AAD3SY27_NEPGR|nr:hypothetical protein Nepgr_021065 [Nepenthes gracilis]
MATPLLLFSLTATSTLSRTMWLRTWWSSAHNLLSRLLQKIWRRPLPLVLLLLLLSLSLDDAGCVVSSQVSMHPNEASGEPLIGRTDPGSEPGVALMDYIPVYEAGMIFNFDHLDELDPDSLFPLQQGGNQDINQGVVGGLPVSYADVLKRGIGNSSADSARPPPIVSPGPLNDLSVLETSCGDPNSNICEQHQLVLPDSVKAIALDALAHTDLSTPPGEVQGVEALNFSSISDGISEDSQESKQKDLSPLARKVAARINTLLRAVDKSAHKDVALHDLAYYLANNLSPRTLDSSLKLKEDTECLSPVIELISHSPPYEATLIAKVPGTCSSTGNKLLSHSVPTIELEEQAVKRPPLSFVDVVSRGLNHSDLQSCDVLLIPISKEDQYAALGNYPPALVVVSSTSSAHQSPASLAE